VVSRKYWRWNLDEHTNDAVTIGLVAAALIILVVIGVAFVVFKLKARRVPNMEPLMNRLDYDDEEDDDDNRDDGGRSYGWIIE
jgi:hypothetical protein